MPTLSHVGKEYRFRCTFAERHLPKDAGFRWSNIAKVWFTNNSMVAAKLRAYADESAESELARLITITPWPAPLPSPPAGFRLKDFQKIAVRFALERNRSYLRLAPGLGKTICAATIARNLGATVGYVCPPFLAENTREEFDKWAPFLNPIIITDTFLDDDFSGELLTGIHCLIVDEAHRFKNADAKRTQALYRLAKTFPKVVLMSGTPMPNRPMELYAVLSNMAPETIDDMNEFDFGRRYCDGQRRYIGRNRTAWDFSGSSNLPELARRVIHPTGPFMLKMEKELLNLPPVIEETFVISATPSRELVKLDKRISDHYKSADDAIKHQIANLLGKLGDDLHVATYRRMLGLEKVEPAIEFIRDALEESDDALVVFAYHKEVIHGLVNGLHAFDPLMITGETPTAHRQRIVKDFQEGNARLIIGNYQAMGTGFTLAKATRAVFTEFSWTPGENRQAIDRLHRIGQKGTVLAQFLTFKNSLDRRILDALLLKGQAIKHL